MMGLSSNCPVSSFFFSRNKRMFLDSCVLNQACEDQDVAKLLEVTGEKYSTFIASISLLEVGFGPRDKADIKQQQEVMELYQHTKTVNSSSIDSIDVLNSNKAGKKYLYIPEEHEWFGARHNLIKWMEQENVGGSSARKQQNDALIFMCAWNANSFLITDNVKDFLRFNVILHNEHGGHLPIFSLEDLKRSQTEEVVFPCNVKNYL
ncbi:type II toxin-antitoxin system VapC family toxin [Pseudoalteromonas prydzensis]|uniref:type II toxin-antitoxin system VapC family toxin n=1 Tax=Pseudoalteromonas prydzensis TaxID=182141 RepID=UPI0012FBA638|nr:hypothetical protein [Pseudoalteromonas prydzensis]